MKRRVKLRAPVASVLRQSTFVEEVRHVQWSSSKKFDGGNVFIAKKFDICESLSKNFDIYIKIIGRDAGIFFRHQAELVLRHRMQVSNYLVKFFYSEG